ncbi:bifunctional methylenetetrahydrofolate dehydrogenase/methenyltetrahydrofolate cyclohydrolase FolD [Oceanidesulfovibrio indonesiensis]|uniref:Bifunctional protein FolD n=1 Tax=Oceanidesulfovibrio indonesiensis TaxID=54767 RepID=A0A7M3MEX6_9BACT|nr:bifunctional methylenetetrahydrofolate dehydrogenase/methenyltetrahydrofolate cyclohydrolase FolD [Oceanidesulfovibrio indonesiensis]TVM17571.1 bifunctional methylenetetrahydrofolate dehydrogenase/methenyltetrahydrofolate cyclohydrolase FolD [Oceanidesulfovibrio indonesiensis]
MILLDGKATAQTIREEIAAEVRTLTAAGNRQPGLHVILVGDDPASAIYVRNKERACEAASIASEAHRLPASTTQDELASLIRQLNEREDVDGILLQLPLPGHLDATPLLEAIDPSKDVDGFHPVNVGNLVLGREGFRSCTPAGVMVLLERYGLSPAGKHAVVIGRSNIVGKPLAIMLGQPGPMGNATVTLCHSRTPDLAEHTRRADFVFAAVGRAKLVTADMVKEGAVVVDVGMNRTDEGLCGDVDFESLQDKVHAITPVPGGVGPMTIAQLLSNTLAAYKRRIGAEG